MHTATGVIGIDIGTSSVKTVAVTLDGEVQGSTDISYSFSSPQSGWAEQQPEDWWTAAVQSLRNLTDLLHQTKHSLDVVGIGLTGQMHGLVLLDHGGQVIRPAILWNDVRTTEEVKYLEEKIGREKIISWTQNPPLPNFTITKLMWVRVHEPDNYRRICFILNPKDYIRYRLTGTLVAEYSDASGTLLLDVANRKWSDEMCHALAIPVEWLPPLTESTKVIGSLTGEAAKASGLSEGIPVVAGAGDQAAGAVSLGIQEQGAISVIFGTSGVVLTSTDRPMLDPGGRLHTFCHALPNRWLLMGVTQSAGGSLQWLRDKLFIGKSYDELIKLSEAVSPGAEGLVFLPYLMGERAPHMDPYARGVWFGLNARQGSEYLVRSVIEGVAFSLYDVWRVMETLGLPAKSVLASGGGAQSELWMQIFASVMKLPVKTVPAFYGPAFGAAALTAMGLGVEINGGWQPEGKSINPIAEWGRIYENSFYVYQEIYKKLRNIFPQVNSQNNGQYSFQNS